jgi:GT2 family glycosyltransferase
MPGPLVSFIVVNWNSGPLLRACLDAIAAQTWQAYEVIVVDNASSDGSADLPCFAQDQWTRITLHENTGFAFANNRGLASASGAYVALVNNDVILAPDWAERMVGALEARPAAGSAACRVLQFRDPERLDSAGCDYLLLGSVMYWHDFPANGVGNGTHHPMGACASAALYRHSALDCTGFLNEPFFCYYEDTDLALRLLLFGYETVYVNDAVARHHGSATGRERSTFHVFHLRRNAEYTYWINMVAGFAWRYLPLHAAFEAAALADACVHGKGWTVLKAKASFLRHLPWVKAERRRLRVRLEAAGEWSAAQKRLSEQPSGLLTIGRRWGGKAWR